MSPECVDLLDRQIIAALMMDGRATWRRVAHALGMPERTVARRGTRLLETRTVSIHAMEDPHTSGRGDPYLLYGSTAPGRAWNVAAHIARRSEALTSSTLLGTANFIADIWVHEHRRATLFGYELPEIGGLTAMHVAPILSYIRALHDWEPGILTADQQDRLDARPAGRWPRFTAERISRQDQQIVDLLVADGRALFDDIAAKCRLSEQTVARRVRALRESGAVMFRAVFDPSVIGFPVGTILWLRVRPGHLNDASRALVALPYLRYAAATVGDFQIVADLRLPSKDHLFELLTEPPWSQHVDVMNTSMILDTLKQSHILSDSLQ
jgi:DNA-binding Lrp family transcriptional regulator